MGNGGSILGAAGGNPLFGSIAIGRKKREIKTDLQILRERLIRTGRDRDETDMKQIKEEIFLEIAKRLEEEKIKRQNTIEATSLSTTTTSTTPASTTSNNSPVQEATFFNLVADQGPQAVGVGLASLTYAAMASLPYWLPALAAGRRRRRRSLRSMTIFNEVQDYHNNQVLNH